MFLIPPPARRHERQRQIPFTCLQTGGDIVPRRIDGSGLHLQDIGEFLAEIGKEAGIFARRRIARDLPISLGGLGRAAVAERPPIRTSAGSARKADVINFESIGHCSFAVREARGSACRHAVFLAQWTGAWRKGLKCLKIRTEADLKSIAKRLKTFEAAVRTDNHLAMSEANKEFHMAIAHAGKNQYLASFYEKLLSQGQRMLHLHFEYLERTHEGYLLTDEHTLMLDAIRDKNVDFADELAHAHTRQFQDNFINFMRENYTTDVALGPLRAAE